MCVYFNSFNFAIDIKSPFIADFIQQLFIIFSDANSHFDNRTANIKIRFDVKNHTFSWESSDLVICKNKTFNERQIGTFIFFTILTKSLPETNK